MTVARVVNSAVDRSNGVVVRKVVGDGRRGSGVVVRGDVVVFGDAGVVGRGAFVVFFGVVGRGVVTAGGVLVTKMATGVVTKATGSGWSLWKCCGIPLRPITGSGTWSASTWPGSTGPASEWPASTWSLSTWSASMWPASA